MRSNRDKRTDSEREIDEFLSQFDPPVDELSADLSQYLDEPAYDSGSAGSTDGEVLLSLFIGPTALHRSLHRILLPQNPFFRMMRHQRIPGRAATSAPEYSD
jgi:hypothetical protein